jgi:mannose-6-phosphate isomerase-like protein (cupin superfamily)
MEDMKITKRGLEDLSFRPAPNRTIGEVFSAQTSGAQGVTFRIVDLAPLSEQKPRHPHWHDGFEEVIHVLGGRGRMWVEGEWYEAAAGDTILIPAGVVHATFNLENQPLRLLCFFPRPDIDPFSIVDESVTLDLVAEEDAQRGAT